MIPRRGGRLLKGLALLAGLCALAACATAPASPGARAPLVKNQPQASVQQGMYYTLEYRYVFRPGGAAGSDQLEFSGHLIPRRGLNTLIVRLHFLDAAGNTLATHVLYAPGAAQGAARTTITKTFDVPPLTANIAFSEFARERVLF